jgi:CHAD domain-containing protein
MTSTLDSGDRAWVKAGQDIVADLATEVAKRAKRISRHGDVDAIHDMRTATRRLRTAIELYGDEAPDDERSPVESELKRVARRLGAVRDLDVLLEALDDVGTHAGLDRHDLSPLRATWRDERRANVKRLEAEVGRRRFRRALRQARSLLSADGTTTPTIAARAPGLIWDRFGRVVEYDIDPAAADPVQIHEVRIAAKKLRYTLEAFKDALQPGATLIEEVTALQDAAGEMHDAIVAGDRARAILDHDHLRSREKSAIDGFADAQSRLAQAQRPAIGKSLRTIRSREFRKALGRAVAGMGHIAPQRQPGSSPT